MHRAPDRSHNRNDILRTGVPIGAGGLIVAVGLGVVADLRPSGLDVAAPLASDPMHLRYSIALFYGSVALLLSVLWSRLSSDAPVVARLRRHVFGALWLSAIGPLLVPAANYAMVTGLTSRHLALLPALLAVVVAALYALTAHRLSGITGVGLGARLMLRSSYIWLLIATGMQFVWVAARVLTGRGDLLWFIERPTLEVALLGFGISASLGVLLTSLNVMYHSRDMTQVLMRGYHGANGLVLLWGLSLMWSIRFPGGYQGLVAAVVGIALMIAFTILAGSSGLLDRQRLPWLGSADPGDGRWASGLASVLMLLVVLAGVLVAICATLLPALGGQPPDGLFAAQGVAVCLGVIPLAVASAMAATARGAGVGPTVGSVFVAIGAPAGTALWAVTGLIAWTALPAIGAEVLVAIGLVSLAVAGGRMSVPEQ